MGGPSGAGKSFSALLIAKGLGGRIAAIDTERGSLSLYDDLVDFDTSELNPPFAPERYVELLWKAEKLGYDTCIIDSITHEWNGSGGCLEINETVAQAKYRGNTWSAWNETTPRHRAFLDAILQSPMHIIATMRSKTDTVQEDKKIKKLGMKAEQRDGTEYEFTILFDLQHGSNLAVVSKDRSRLFRERPPFLITEDTGRALKQWLDSGAKVQVGTPEQVKQLLDLAGQIGLPQETLDKWVGTAGARCVEDMPADYLLKCIEFCRKKLPPTA